ncbi:helix-turn-helix domain-containing protein [Halobacterium yunchengense]|uniref:helix-turn-helix domain-containing protein n=1 Tax=Halobacterium yunchengense TaxID=3108497 RepID=UPI003007F254
MNRVTFEAAYPPEYTHPVHAAVVERDALSRVSVLTWGPVGSATTLTVFDAGEDVVRDVLAGVDAVADWSLVADPDGTFAFTRQTEYGFAAPLLDLVAAADAAFLPPLTFRADRTARFEAVGDSAALAAFHEDLSAVLDARVASVRDFEHGDAPAALTGRQREALAAALDCGYYDVPRTGSVADVAAALDCATSTAGELLRKAEAAVVRDAVGGR